MKSNLAAEEHSQKAAWSGPIRTFTEQHAPR